MTAWPVKSAALVALGLAGVLAGCGGSSTPAAGGSSAPPATQSSSSGGGSSAPASSQGGAPSNVQACSLMSQSDAATISGDSSVASSTTGVAGANICFYMDLTGSGAGTSVEAFVEPAPGLSAAIVQAALSQQAKTSGNYQEVSGIGDIAYAQAGDNDAWIAFVKNNTLVVAGASSTTKSGSDLLGNVEQWAKGAVGGV